MHQPVPHPIKVLNLSLYCFKRKFVLVEWGRQSSVRTFASIVHVRRGELVNFIKSKGFLFEKFTYLCVFVLYTCVCVCVHLGMSVCT